MYRRLVPISALAGAALALASCSTAVAGVTVGSTTVSQSELISQAKAYEASPAISGPSSTSSKSGTVPTQVTANLAKSDIAEALVSRILAHRGVRVTALERKLVNDQLLAQMSGGSGGGSGTKGITPAFRRFLLDQETGTLALEASLGKVDLTAGGIRSYYNAHAGSFETVCLEDALYSTSAGAESARSAIAGGTSFTKATSAAQSTSGANPDCAPIAPLPPALRQAILTTPVGQVGPVEPVSAPAQQGGAPSPTGYAVFEVVSVKPVPYSDAEMPLVASQMLQGTAAVSLQSEVEALVKAEALTTRISVNPVDGKLIVGNAQLLGFDVTVPVSPPASQLPSTTSSTSTVLPGLPTG